MMRGDEAAAVPVPGVRSSVELLCFLTLMGLALAGCRPNHRPDHVRSMFSAEFNCAEEDIDVEEIATERLRAQGCGSNVTYFCGSEGCIPSTIERAPARAKVPEIARGQAPSERVADERPGDTKGSLSTEIRLPDKAMLQLRLSPEQGGKSVRLKVLRVEAEPEITQCDVKLMINGEVSSLPKSRPARQQSLSSVSVELSREFVRELGSARKLSLRLCDRRWTLDAEQLEELHRFTERYEDELAWLSDPRKPSESGLIAPVDGWPDWSPKGAPPAPVNSGRALDPPALFELVSPSVLQIQTVRSTSDLGGSGIAVSRNELLTNCHVLDGARKIIVKQKETEWVATLVRSDPKRDRCVLRIPDGVLTPIRGVRPYSELKVGEALYTLGAPSGLALSLADGILSGLREEAGVKLVQTTAPISPGSSGGGLFDARGNLVGITTLVWVGRQHLNQSLNFAIPADAFWQP